MGIRITIPHADFSTNGIPVKTNSSITAKVVSLQITGNATATNGAAYSVTATFDDGSTQNVTSQASWNISEASCSIEAGVVAAPDVIDKSGVVITASYGGKSTTKTVTVKGAVSVGTYLKTTADGQYISLNDYVTEDGTTFGSIKIKVVFKINDVAGTNEQVWAVSTRNYLQGAYFAANSVGTPYVTAKSSDGMSQTVPLTTDTDITVEVDNTGSNYKTILNGTESEYNGQSLPTSTVQSLAVFCGLSAGGVNTAHSKSGLLAIKTLQVWSTKGGSEHLLFDGVPAVVDSRPCLYDRVKKTAKYANSGELVIE